MKRIVRFMVVILSLLILLSSISSADEMVTYTVKKGDSLSRIAEYFDLSLEKIIAANQLNNPNLIITGEELNIPVEQTIYVIKNGDSLWKIADAHNVSLEKIIEINNIKNPDLIYQGQKITIPEKTVERKRYILASRNRTMNLIWPVQGVISSEFGWRMHPIHRRNEFHTGIDIAVPIGTPVFAAEDGVVTFSGWSSGYGRLVILQHRDGSKTYYAHNLQLTVQKGEQVKQGKIISLSGNSGLSTGPHLHFEVRVNDRVVDPMRYLNQKYFKNGFRV